MAVILIVDANDGHSATVQSLSSDNHRVQLVTSGLEARTMVEVAQPDLVLIDPDLSDVNGVALCRRLKTWPAKPVIAMSSDDRESTHLQLFAAGVDDVVAKPVSMDVLTARIRVQLRHAAQSTTVTGEVLDVGALRIDTASLEAQIDGRPLILSTRQFAVLRLFMHNIGLAVTPDVISRVLGHDGTEDSHNSVRTSVSKLRSSIGIGPNIPQILRERTGGYKLVPPDPAGTLIPPSRPCSPA